ncbi:hypothetical protein [uncultured Cohaesibacter sp.]|uniref:hypothetical protein n=1 Tax=uncultured Cohaesibacter sp. TaxID=1002546 RepID=UPI00292E6446|nr:hypothetical protein [uncultured Cohaesibacter sp.]
MSLVCSFFQRPDASDVGWLWLERLVYESSHRGYWNGLELNPLGQLVELLASKLSLMVDPLVWIDRARGPLWRVDRLGAVLAVLSKDETITADNKAGTLSSLLIEVQPQFAGADSKLANSGGVLGLAGAACLFHATDPVEVVKRLWDELRPLREQGWGFPKANDANQAAELMIVWAIVTMQHLEGQRKTDLWICLCELLETAMKQDYRCTNNPFWPEALKSLTLSISEIMGGERINDVSVLEGFLRPYLYKGSLFFELHHALVSAGIAPDILEGALNSLNVSTIELADRFLVANKLRIEKGYEDFHLVSYVRNIFHSV